MIYKQTQDTIVSISIVMKTSERLQMNGKTKNTHTSILGIFTYKDHAPIVSKVKK
ncbi:MAG: hypothetical protein IJN85_01335 [Oscillospiraceae bacterium]|nr:hypothetical protein [Oscillospiraceae bacterium]